MRHLVLPIIVIASTLATGCVVYDTDARTDGPLVGTSDTVLNYAPEVYDAEAGCYFDRGERDDIWYFEGYVDDLDGINDIDSVWADVYDEFDGSLVESFELYPTDDPQVWYSDWLGRTTWLDCYYTDYTVDIVAYDVYEDFGMMTVVPYTY